MRTKLFDFMRIELLFAIFMRMLIGMTPRGRPPLSPTGEKTKPWNLTIPQPLRGEIEATAKRLGFSSASAWITKTMQDRVDELK
jgi:hypothetical protein